MRMPAGSRPFMRELNRAAVLRTIREKGPISRTSISDMSHLSSATVTNIVADLISRGFVREAGYGDSAGGRRRVLLEFTPDAGYILGIEIGHQRVRAGLVDLGANIHSISIVDADDRTPQAIVKAVVRAVQRIAGKMREPIFGAGVGIAGLVKPESGIVSRVDLAGWQDVPLKALLERAMDIDVIIENDCNAAALAEASFGAGRGAADLFYVTAGAGIGGALILGSQLHRGPDGSAGEFGHMVVDINGPLCSCGNHGCLEALASEQALLARAEDIVGNTARSGAVPLLQNPMELLAEAIVCGDRKAIRAATETGRILGVGIAGIVNLINLERVVIGGSLASLGDHFFDAIRQTVSRMALAVPAGRISILPAALGEDIGIIGPAATQVRRILEAPGVCPDKRAMGREKREVEF